MIFYTNWTSEVDIARGETCSLTLNRNLEVRPTSLAYAPWLLSMAHTSKFKSIQFRILILSSGVDPSHRDVNKMTMGAWAERIGVRWNEKRKFNTSKKTRWEGRNWHKRDGGYSLNNDVEDLANNQYENCTISRGIPHSWWSLIYPEYLTLCIRQVLWHV
jgi:hypothetical protein